MERQPAKVSYYFGKGYQELWNTNKTSWRLNLETAQDYLDKVSDGNWIQKVFYIGLALSVVVFGTVFFLVISVLHILILFTFFLIVYFLFSFVWVIDYLFRVKERAFTACPNPRCYKKSPLPTFICPSCGAKHTQLWPSKYGILKRTCECGEKIPCTFLNRRGKLEAICPHCKQKISAEERTPIIIPVIGPPSAGKTTYLYSLLACLEQEAEKKGYEFKISTRSKMNEKLFVDNVKRLNSGGIVDKTQSHDISAIDVFFSKGSKKYAVYFYDPPGESFSQLANLQQYNFYAYYNAMLFILDPFAIEDVRIEYYEQLKKDGLANIYDKALGLEDTFNNLKGTLEINFGIKADARVGQKLAVIIPKTDLYELEKHFAKEKANKASRSFLTHFGQKQFLNNILWKFKDVQFFNVASKGKHSKGVLEPFDWILEAEMSKTRVRRIFLNVVLAFFITVVVGLFGAGLYLGYQGLSQLDFNFRKEVVPVKEEVMAQLVPNYYCTANSLNIRSTPSANGTVIGSLKKGNEIYVYEENIVKGFAKIDYAGQIAYVSNKFLKKKLEEPLKTDR